jgi:hypothetical protein
MSIGGAGNNRQPTNIVSYPSTSPNANLKVGDPELNAHGRFVAEQQAQAKTVALADGLQRTAQAQPPGKSFTETMGAAFTAMGAAVTNFFKGLGDRMASIELPQLPRISLRRQEAVQAEAAAPQRPADPFEAAMGGKPVSAKVRADFTAFAQVASALGKNTAAIIDHILALPEGNAVAKAFDALATRRLDQPNLQVMKALRSEEGLSLSHLVSNFVKSGAEQELNLSHNQGLVASIVDINGKLNKLGLKDAVVRQVPNENGPGFSLQVSSPRGAVGGEAIDLLRQMEVKVGILAGSVHKEMSSQLKDMGRGGLMESSGQQPEQRLFKAGLAALADGAKAVGNAAASNQAELGRLEQMSTPDFAQALRADPSMARHLPQMSADSPARQEYENFVAGQPPMSRQAATEGFYQMVKESAIKESLRDGGLINDDPLDDVEAEPDFSNIPGIGLPGPVSTGTPSGLPQVELNSLAHLFNLPQGKNMAGLQENLVKQFCGENMDALTTGAALFKFEDSAGLEAAPDFSNYSSVSRSLIADLPIVQQWADNFVKAGARQEINLAGGMQDRVLSALGNVSGSGVLATESQRTELTEAIATFLFQTVAIVNSGQSSSYLKP